MQKCIFCDRTEEEFVNGNIFTEEHIIPEALGNKNLKIYSVCKECNSGLGTYVDKYFVNHKLVEIIRQYLKLAGQSGTIPNPFKEGRDKYDNLIRLDEENQPYVVSSLISDGSKIKIIASTDKEAKEIAYKKLKRMGYTDKQIENILKNISYKNDNYQAELKYDIPIEFNRFYMEALKIAYEYAFYNLGDTYLEDITSQKIKAYLYKAIKGEMKDKCSKFPDVSMMPEVIYEKFKQGVDMKLTSHMITFHADAANKLIVDVMLFMEKIFSFSVCVSKDASQYQNIKVPLAVTIPISSNKKADS